MRIKKVTSETLVRLLKRHEHAGVEYQPESIVDVEDPERVSRLVAEGVAAPLTPAEMKTFNNSEDNGNERN